jgi:transposase
MGRSRGGLTTKIHAALVDADGLPIALKLTEEQGHEGPSAQDVLGGIGEGRILLADRAYDADRLRDDLAARGAVGSWYATLRFPSPSTGPTNALHRAAAM